MCFEDNFSGWTGNAPSSVSSVAYAGSKLAKISGRARHLG